MKILIVQSNPIWIQFLAGALSAQLPEIAKWICFSASFDAAVNWARSEKSEMLIITSDMFHDTGDTQTIPDNHKSGNELARIIRESNPLAKVYVFSNYIPASEEFLAGRIKKGSGNNEYDISELLQLIEREAKI